jgi:hypothetical protein
VRLQVGVSDADTLADGDAVWGGEKEAVGDTESEVVCVRDAVWERDQVGETLWDTVGEAEAVRVAVAVCEKEKLCVQDAFSCHATDPATASNPVATA